MKGLTALVYIVSFYTLITSAPSYSEMRNDIPSCYENLNVDSPSVEAGRDFFVIIDGTFDPDLNLKRSIHNKVHGFMKPNDRISIVSFSSYIGDSYTALQFSGELEPQIPTKDRSSISKKVLKRFDHCMAQQRAFSRGAIDSAIKSSFKLEGVEVPKSEIVANLSHLLEPLLEEGSSGGSDNSKIVLIVSDMLENSDITSFYKSGEVRVVDAQIEMDKMKSGGYVSNWQGAKVYVIGAGWVPEKYRGKFRGSNVMKSLQNFWKLYFESSNATLIAFGQPELMQELR